MKRTILILASALVLVCCTDAGLATIDGRLSEGEQSLQQLTGRITTVEQTLLQINSDIRSLTVLRGGVTINSVEGGDESGWTLKLGDGTTVTVPPQGPKGNAPVISLDEEGFWMVDYGDGPVYILDVNGDKVSHVGYGESGSDAAFSPLLGVNEDGNWQVSYDGGATWDLLPDSAGNTVKAEVEIAETLFESVVTGEKSVTFTLKNGESFTLPLVVNFICSIQGASEVQNFASGQSRDFEVELEGVLQLFVTFPDGWSAKLAGTTLSVTAPAVTKVYFDSSESVALYAVSTDGHSAISSMKVAISE